MEKEPKLTVKQKIFAERYAANGGNATEASSFAGYKKTEVEGCRLLRNAKVQNYIKSLTKSVDDSRIATAIERQQFWSATMRGEIGDKSVDRDGNEIVTYKLSDRIKASEILGKSQCDFVEKVEIDMTLEVSLEEVLIRARARINGKT